MAEIAYTGPSVNTGHYVFGIRTGLSPFSQYTVHTASVDLGRLERDTATLQPGGRNTPPIHSVGNEKPGSGTLVLVASGTATDLYFVLYDYFKNITLFDIEYYYVDSSGSQDSKVWELTDVKVTALDMPKGDGSSANPLTVSVDIMWTTAEFNDAA